MRDGDNVAGWDGIDEFLAVATAGSFVGGARALGVSTTHISRAVMALEQRVDALLFNRTTRSVRLTDAGHVFLDRCSRIVQERDEAIALISERAAPQGNLRVTCSTAMGEQFVAPLLRRYAADHPRVTITLELTNRIVDLVGEGFDLAIRTGQLADSRLIRTRVAKRGLMTCAAPAYLAQAGVPLTIADLAGHDCLVGAASGWQYLVDGKLLHHRPHGRFRCDSGRAIVEACAEGMGICQLPDFFVRPYIAAGQIVPVLEDFRPEEEPIWAVYRQRRHLLPKISLLVDRLQAEFEPLIAATHL